MNIFPAFLLVSLLLYSTGLLAQNGPPAEVDKTIRATVDVLMDASATDYKKFIAQHYSRKHTSNASMDSLVNHIEVIKKLTEGAGGIEVANEDGVIKISFSGDVDAVVELNFESDDMGKIRSLNLAQSKNPLEMTDAEIYDNALKGRMKKFESLPRINTDSGFEFFIKENFSPSFISGRSMDGLIGSLRELRVAVASATMFGAKPSESDKGAILELRGGKSADVMFTIEENAPYRINQFEINDDVSFLDNDSAELLPVTWQNYKDLLEQEEAKGFSGLVLMVRNGNIEHEVGYGLANREAGIRNSVKTLYDIGSIPIDFTCAAVLKLVDEGKISYANTLSQFFDNVPDDKKSITIEHLITNKSGLHNFHGDDTIDNDPDLSWISREEAIDRILSRYLLFEPGTDVSPSHSGYGLLAAVVEIVSGKTYEAFLADNFLTPLNMKNTGPYGNDSGLNPENMAVGYGKLVSQPNIPANWGRTSWLIKGSGGMVSNPMDLYLWNKGLHYGKILSQKSKEIYHQGKMALGGSERGFFTAYVRSPDNIVIICSNSDRSEYPDIMVLFQSLASLCK